MVKQLFLNLSLPGWVFLIFVLILVTVAVFYYRRTLPPLLPWRRGFLTVLRSGVDVRGSFGFSFEPGRANAQRMARSSAC